MVDRDIFHRRLAKLEELVRDLRRVAGSDRGVFLQDRDLQAAAERRLHLAAECVLDLAYHLIADRGWATPATKRETFEVLHREGVLSAEQAEQMVGWAGLRNVLVHVYLDIDYPRLYEILTRELDSLEKYARAMAEILDD